MSLNENNEQNPYSGNSPTMSLGENRNDTSHPPRGNGSALVSLDCLIDLLRRVADNSLGFSDVVFGAISLVAQQLPFLGLIYQIV
ncbi:unnamed protein product [Leptosia nina]|uniref:Uncharacterized protein n=1 Tax=Leptosia nina TaxID=320188 RepID=A0AAV1JS33_9NEOP